MSLNRPHFFSALLLGAILCSPVAYAQEIVFQTSFDENDGFVELATNEDIGVTFGYDYVDFDLIPEAPNSGLLSGDEFTGLKLEANVEFGEASAIAMVTEGLDLSGSYEFQVDAWLNFNPPAGGSGTTEFGGIGVGHDGSSTGLNGASFLYDTDGDSSLDYRMFKDVSLIGLDTGQYALDSLNNTGDIVSEAFPGIDLETATTEPFYEGTTPDGSGSFRWMTVKVVVDTEAIGVGNTTDPGIATFSLTDEASGNAVEIGTIDNSAGDGVVNMSGNVSILFADLFTSVAPNGGEFNFGIFDNMIVTTLPDMSDPLDCDMDGMVGTSDIACATAETIADTLAAANIIAGDLNLDGVVEFPDFLTLSGNFGDPEAAGVYANGDIDLSGEIDFPDFLALSGNFGLSSAELAAVPEPGGFVLLLMPMLLLARLRMRRQR